MSDKFAQFVRGEISEAQYLGKELVLEVGTRVSTPHGTGTIVHITGIRNIGVEHDRNMGGHNCQGHCPSGYGWYHNKKDLKVI